MTAPTHSKPLRYLPTKKPNRLRWFAARLTDSDDIGSTKPKPRQVWDATAEYNLVSSLADDGYHYPALDIDIPCRYVKSSTKGHGHLYFDNLRMTWPQYVALLGALSNAGIISPQYLAWSLKHEMTTLRPEHIRKKNSDRPAKAKKQPKPLLNDEPDWMF